MVKYHEFVRTPHPFIMSSEPAVRSPRSTFWNLVVLSEIIFVVKALISLTRKIPSVLPDEVCVIQRALHFSQTLRIDTCEAISGLPGGDPLPFYSIVVSPVYRFFHGLTAFHVALIVNAFLVATLVFPLYGILKRFVANTKALFVSIIIILFSAQIVIFDSTMMTETVFIVLNVWFTYFYLKSFEEHRWRNKLVAVLIAIAAALARPFGFIVLISMMVNEAIQMKGKERKILLPALGLVAIIFTAITLIFFNSNMLAKLWGYTAFLAHIDGWKNIALALVEQVNSFSLATFLIPLIVFFSYIGEKDSKLLNAIRWYLLAYITLNFLISAQHIYGYLVVDSDPGLLTRYINSALIYIYIFSFAFFLRYDRFEFTKKTTFISALFIILLLFLPTGFKHSLSPDLSIYGNIYVHLFGKDVTPVNDLLRYYFLPASFLLFLLLARGKKMLLSGVFVLLMLINGFYLIVTLVPQGYVPSYLSFFVDKKENIAVIATHEQTQSSVQYYDAIWEIIAASENKVHPIVVDFDDLDYEKRTIPLRSLEHSEFYKNSKYILSQYELDLPMVFGWDDIYLYANPKAFPEGTFVKNNS